MKSEMEQKLKHKYTHLLPEQRSNVQTNVARLLQQNTSAKVSLLVGKVQLNCLRRTMK